MYLNLDAAKEQIKLKISCLEYLEKSQAGNYICPVCGSGTGKNKTGALNYYPKTNTWTCFSGKCGRSGDVIDLYQVKTGKGYLEAVNDLAAQIGITVDRAPLQKTSVAAPQRAFSSNGNTESQNEGKSPQEGAQAPQTQNDFTEYYSACEKALEQAQEAQAYLNARGISKEAAYLYRIGYDPKKRRIIIPCSDAFYIARAIDPGNKKKYMNPGGSSTDLFNGVALINRSAGAVFVTEGAIDALSIMETGAEAIAINSSSNAKHFLDAIDKTPTENTLILCMDKDAAGGKATQTLREGLKQRNVSFLTADITCGYDDANAALIADREAFFQAVNQARRKAAARPDNTAFYIDAFMQEEIDRFKGETKTGFSNLDAYGGLFPGLYAIGAISSLGKTTFCLQLADQLAASGQDVLFFSLEQSRLELVSKSLARKLAQKGIRAETGYPVTSLAIRKGLYAPLVRQVAEEYKGEVGERISIIEGNFSCNFPFISDYCRRYVKRNPGSRPIVIVDYLQVLEPGAAAKQKGTLKEAIDLMVTGLKRLSRDLDLTVIVISSLNRRNYLAPIDFDAYKESGGIEYSADCVWGLQLACLEEDLFGDEKKSVIEKRDRVRECKKAVPRKVELVCLKNRFGISSFTCYFDYYPDKELFQEAEAPIANEDVLKSALKRRGSKGK